MTKITTEEISRASGKLAIAARYVVGGRDINGFIIAPATVHDMHIALKALEQALDEYDSLVLEEAMQE